MIFLSYFAAHWVLFVIVVLAVIGLLAATWFLKNWKFAAAAIVLVIAALAYQSANMDGYKRKVDEDAKAQVVVLQKRLLAVNFALADDAKLAAANAELNSKLEALSRETPHNDSPCLDLAAARRVRAIRSGLGHRPAAPATRRPASLLPKLSPAP